MNELHKPWEAITQRCLSWLKVWLAGANWWWKVWLAAIVLGQLFNGGLTIDFFSEKWADADHVEHFAHQLADPASVLNYSPDSHESKLLFRVSYLPVLALIGTSFPAVALFQAFTGLALFLLMLAVLHRWTGDRVTSAIGVWLLSLTMPGATAFLLDPIGFFDGWSLCWLLAMLLTRNPVWLLAFSLMAFFSDERAVVAAGFVFVLQVYYSPRLPAFRFGGHLPETQTPPRTQALPAVKWWRNSLGLSLLLGLLIYFGARQLVLRTLGLEIPLGEDPDLGLGALRMNDTYLPLTTFLALEFAWALVILAGVYLRLLRKYFQLGVLAVTLLALIGLSHVVLDVSRSLTYLLPVLPLCLVIVHTYQPGEKLHRLLLSLCMATLVFPAYFYGGGSLLLGFPLPLQIMLYLL